MPAWLSTSINVITLLVMLLGLFGLIVPIFPGLVIIWIAALIFGIIHGFTTLGWALFAIITILMLIGNVIDGVLMGAKALEHGAAKSSIVYALIAAIVVSFFLSPIGGLLAAPLVLYVSEQARGHSPKEAWAITRGLLTGWGWAFAARFGIGIVMIVLWGVWVYQT